MRAAEGLEGVRCVEHGPRVRHEQLAAVLELPRPQRVADDPRQRASRRRGAASRAYEARARRACVEGRRLGRAVGPRSANRSSTRGRRAVLDQVEQPRQSGAPAGAPVSSAAAGPPAAGTRPAGSRIACQTRRERLGPGSLGERAASSSDAAYAAPAAPRSALSGRRHALSGTGRLEAQRLGELAGDLCFTPSAFAACWAYQRREPLARPAVGDEAAVEPRVGGLVEDDGVVAAVRDLDPLGWPGRTGRRSRRASRLTASWTTSGSVVRPRARRSPSPSTGRAARQQLADALAPSAASSARRGG